MRHPNTPLKDQSSPELDQFLTLRHRKAKLWEAVFKLSTLVAVIFLATLILTVFNRTMGLTAVENKKDPATLSSLPLEQLSAVELSQILRDNLSKNRIRTIERQGGLEERKPKELYVLVMEEVVQPKVVKSYNLFESIVNRSRIITEINNEYPKATVAFRSWLNARFLTEPMSSKPELAGVRTALLGSLFLILVTILIAFPIGVGAAIYLEEYASRDHWINRIIQTNIDNLAGVPSIVYGILGLALFVRALAPITSGSIFGYEGGNGRSILAAGMTMALLILPILIINAQEAIRAVPNSLRQASYGLGATKWQTIWNHVLPYALPGILTGTILAVSRAIGETAPLIVVGASTFITSDPGGPFANFTALPIQIYNWTTRPQDQFRNIAAAAIIVLLVLLLSMNAIAILLRNRFSRRL